jgi:C4-dicarboxylate transporter DctQ subunit
MLHRFMNRLEEVLIGLLLAAMTLVTFGQVVMRYVFNSGFTWAQGATTFMFGWLVLIGISYGIRVNSHIGVDVWVKKLPPRGKRAAAYVGIVVCLLYAVLMLIGSTRYLRVMYILGVEVEDMPIQSWILHLALPLGFTLLLGRLIEVAWRIWQGRQSGLLADEAEEHIRAAKIRESLLGEGRP